MVRSLLFFPLVPATKTNEDCLDGWLISVSGSMRQSITADPKQKTATNADQRSRGIAVDNNPKSSAHVVPAESGKKK
jgi:hypothetical protein